MLIDVDTRKPLTFIRKIASPEGDEVSIQIHYEKLFKHCKTCGMPLLRHEQPHDGYENHGHERNSRRSRSLSREQLYDGGLYERCQGAHRRYDEYKERFPGIHGRTDRKMYSASTRQSSRYAPYEKKKQQSWRIKGDIGGPSTQQSAGLMVQDAQQSSGKRIVLGSKTATDKDPNRQWTSSSMAIGPRTSQARSLRSDRARTRLGRYIAWRVIASLIVTPSRHAHDDNVTKRPRVSPRLLTFSPTEEVLPVDAQVIGALNDMEITSNRAERLHDTVMVEGDNEDDLLGEDLMDMEADIVKRGMRGTSMIHDFSRSRNPHPRIRMEECVEPLWVFKARRRSSSVEDLQRFTDPHLETHLTHRDNVLVRGKVRKAVHTRVMVWRGPKIPPDIIHEENQLGLSRDRERPHSLTPYGDIKALSQWRIQHNVNSAKQVEELGEKVEDGSWTSTSQFSGYGWVWMDSLEKVQLMGTQNYPRRESALHSEVEALRWAMESMLQHSTCQRFETDCKDFIAMIKEPYAWLSFATELEKIETLKICFPDFKIIHIPRAQNSISNFLAKTARSFYRDLCFIGCSILV
ncbi:hypothetical protein F2Q70_00035737 [Brassica cretica]|uniref:RNase H type-1 domain-containing protein n=1 Tax=Brassica cretica TaxID=69181 RepID=A0A8S9JYL8_BRACR|nr:hypothetical protein F2Q70_00035737 [Brassica cretica]